MYSKKFLTKSVLNTPFSRPISNLNVNGSSSQCNIHEIILSGINNKMKNVVTKVRVLYRSGRFYELLKQKFCTAPGKFKDQSAIIIRAWTQQCEYVVAQRFRRSQQMFCLYTRLWEEKALKELMKRMRQHMTRRSKELILGAMGVSTFNWEAEKITDEEITSHVHEFEYLKMLQQKTIICQKCRKQKSVDAVLPEKKEQYCKCPCVSGEIKLELDNWVPFIERPDLLVWRRYHGDSKYYEYKLYGRYDDVSADDFLQVQIDTEYRLHWDATAIALQVVDSDAKSNSDIVYWEMLWPRLFSNRDYVYNRRYTIDRERKMITIVSRSTYHPACPIKPDKFRVSDYESVMVIKPTTDLDKPGIEFCLTYYDNPGINIPGAINTWVAMAAMPDFLVKLRNAAKEYHRQQELKEKQAKTEAEENGLVTTMPVAEEEQMPVTTLPAAEEIAEVLHEPAEVKVPFTTIPNAEESVHPTSNSQPETETATGYWRYIHPYYYLG